jgi:hypothetical protein
LCTKTGWLVAYYPDDAVTVEGETVAYVWGDRMIGIHHCPLRCGRTGRRWRGFREDGRACAAAGGFDVTRIEVRLLDNSAGEAHRPTLPSRDHLASVRQCRILFPVTKPPLHTVVETPTS